MLALIISIGVSGAVGITVFQYTNFSITWGIVSGVLVFILLQVIIGLFTRRIVKKRTNNIQNIIMAGQEKLNRKIQFFQQKPQGGMKTMQKILEKDQHIFIREALSATKYLEPLFYWNILLRKQVNTMRMQFYYQLKEFVEVDKLIPKSMYMEPMSIAMKMARQYKNNDQGYKKTFKRKIRKYKGDNAALLYSVYAWMLVKNSKIEEAIKAKKLENDSMETALQVFDQAIKNLAPQLEVRGCRVGGANYQVPFPVRGDRKYALAFRWLIEASQKKKGKPISVAIADELMALLKEEGDAFKKRADVHRMAESNRAFAHFAR